MSQLPKIMTVAAIALLFSTTPALAKNQAAIVAGEVTAFANHFANNPDLAIDLTKVSGEFCYNGGLGKGGHMSHYATDPTSTQEDVLDFVKATPLTDAGADFSGLPKHPGTLGSMTPNQWYLLPAGNYEPHHGRKFPFDLLIRASNIK